MSQSVLLLLWLKASVRYSNYFSRGACIRWISIFTEVSFWSLSGGIGCSVWDAGVNECLLGCRLQQNSFKEKFRSARFKRGWVEVRNYLKFVYAKRCSDVFFTWWWHLDVWLFKLIGNFFLSVLMVQFHFDVSQSSRPRCILQVVVCHYLFHSLLSKHLFIEDDGADRHRHSFGSRCHHFWLSVLVCFTDSTLIAKLFFSGTLTLSNATMPKRCFVGKVVACADSC